MKERATVICRRETRILLVSKDDYRWALPGGKRETDEDIGVAAARVLFEETGLRALSMKYMFEFVGARTRHHVFVARIANSDLAVPNNEIVGCRWVEVTRVRELSTSVSTRGIIDALATSRTRCLDQQELHRRRNSFLRRLRLALQKALTRISMC